MKIVPSKSAILTGLVVVPLVIFVLKKLPASWTWANAFKPNTP